MTNSPITRRAFIVGAAGATAAALSRAAWTAAGPVKTFALTAAQTAIPMVGARHPKTSVWSFGTDVPGPEIRVRQGETIRAAVRNTLGQGTSAHWHGVRLPNRMDGVPHVTQAPIKPGEKFVYEFAAQDAGTFWYHSHANSVEQLARGLYGPLIVEEAAPPAAERDVTWVLDDWRLDRRAQIVGGFNNFHDRSHAGRLGNTVTVNGRVLDTYAVRAGERIRLRLVNAANARIFRLRFEGHDPWLIALDAHPLAPRRLPGGRLVLGPGMRADLILDMTGAPGSRARVIDDYFERRAYRLVDLVYGKTQLKREKPLGPPKKLPDNPVPEPDLAKAKRHAITFGGGAMGGMMMGRGRRGQMMGPGMHGHERMDLGMPPRAAMRRGMFWTINGKVYETTPAEGRPPTLLTLEAGRSHIFSMHNHTSFDHPMHLHGYAFRVVKRNGVTLKDRILQDTVMMAPHDRVDIAFVADNPGDWLFHCHIAEHMAAGMMGVIKVA